MLIPLKNFVALIFLLAEDLLTGYALAIAHLSQPLLCLLHVIVRVVNRCWLITLLFLLLSRGYAEGIIHVLQFGRVIRFQWDWLQILLRRLLWLERVEEVVTVKIDIQLLRI